MEPTPTNPLPLPPVTPAKKKRGCFFYGCLTFSILVVLGFVLSATGLYFGYKNFKAKFQEFTDTAPLPLHIEELSQQELEELQNRAARFVRDSKSGVPTPPLLLSSRDINALIQTEPQLAQVKDHIRIDIVGDQIHATVSMPLDFVQQPGRYVNGSAGIRLIQGKYGAELYLESLEVHGQALPQELMDQLRGMNLLEKARENKQNEEFLKLMERIVIQDGKLIFFARSSTSL